VRFWIVLKVEKALWMYIRRNHPSGSSFFVAYYEPANDATGNRERCEVYFNQHGLGDKACIRALDFWKNGLAF
jgi:hypothetical protein